MAISHVMPSSNFPLNEQWISQKLASNFDKQLQCRWSWLLVIK